MPTLRGTQDVVLTGLKQIQSGEVNMIVNSSNSLISVSVVISPVVIAKTIIILGVPYSTGANYGNNQTYMFDLAILSMKGSFPNNNTLQITKNSLLYNNGYTITIPWQIAEFY